MRDHPHACGDKRCVFEVLPLVSGSSPRVWGQVCGDTLLMAIFGIIPTRVGTSLFKARKITIYGDHPHACGDKEAIQTVSDDMTGSSPRVWGQASDTPQGSLSDGIIPTRVGTSCSVCRAVSKLQDHPHACGDKL